MKKREREREGGERGRKKKKKEKQVQISQHLKWRQMKSLHNDHRGSSAASLMDFCVLKQNVFKLTKEGRERERMFSNRRESQHKHTLCVWGWKKERMRHRQSKKNKTKNLGGRRKGETKKERGRQLRKKLPLWKVSKCVCLGKSSDSHTNWLQSSFSEREREREREPG